MSSDSFVVPLLVGLFGYVLVCVSFLRGLFAVAAALDGLLSDVYGEAIYRWQQKTLGSTQVWSSAVLDALDALFKTEFLSWPAFIRCAVVSLLSVVMLFIVWSVLHPLDSIGLLSVAPVRILTSIIVLALILTVIPNYLALIETRTLLAVARKRVPIAFIAAVDVILTVLIATLVMWPLHVFMGDNESASSLLDDATNLFEFEHYLVYAVESDQLIAIFDSNHYSGAGLTTARGAKIVGRLPLWIFGYTVFVTSGIVWLLGLVRLWGGDLMNRLPWQNKPFQCLALIPGILLALAFVIGLPYLLTSIYSEYTAIQS